MSIGQLPDITITAQTTTAPQPSILQNPVHLLQTVNVINANISELIKDKSFVVNQQQLFSDKRGKETPSDTETLAKNNEAKIELLRNRINISPNSINSSLLPSDLKKSTDSNNSDFHSTRERSPMSQPSSSRDKRYVRH